MRKIEKRSEPKEMVQWRAANQADSNGCGINFGYEALRQSHNVINRLMDSLLAEQGGLCAYTGMKIERNSAHVEHLVAQTHCERGQDVAYANMVACWPEPNGPHGQFGAHAKDSWPSPSESSSFVSPLSEGCEKRFKYNQRGEIMPATSNDQATFLTIRKLKLDHKTLTAMRRIEIDSVLGKKRALKLKQARSRLSRIREEENQLNNGADVNLNPYCFALKQALEKFIATGEFIIRKRKLA